MVSLLQRKRLCPAFLCEDSANLTCFAPAQRPRLHETSRLSSRSFHDVRLKAGALSFALLASERIFYATMSRTIVTQVQAEVQAAFDRDTLDSAFKKTESIVATIVTINVKIKADGMVLSLRWGCREHFVSGCWHSSGRDCGRYPWECWWSTLGVLHPGVPVMWYGHIRDLSPTAEGCMGGRLPNATSLHWAQQE